KSTGSPQAEGIWPFVVVRAGDEDVAESRQAPAHALDLRMEEANEIDRDEGDFVRAIVQDDGADLEGIVNAGGLAVVTETGHVDGFVLHGRRDVRLGEAGLQLVTGW